MKSKKENGKKHLLGKPIVVLNIGLENFSHELAECDTPVIQLDWKPSAGGNPELANLLSKLGI